MKQLTFSSGAEVQDYFGSPLLARRKTLVRRRDAIGTEVFRKTEGDLTAVQGVDYVLEPLDGSQSNPCKINIFADSWEETEPGSEVYRRKALCKAVPVPEGYEVILKCLEGDLKVYHPNFIAIGIKDEVYSYRKEWVEKNLDFLPS